MAEKISKEEMVQFLQQEVENFLSRDLYEMHVSKEKLLWIQEQKENLKEDLRKCRELDDEAKHRVKDFMRKTLSETYFNQEKFWKKVWYFDSYHAHSFEAELEMALYMAEKKYGKDGFRIYWQEKDQRSYGNTRNKTIPTKEKEEFLIEILYRETFGLGKIEAFLDFSLDGISCGVSQDEEGFYPFWIMQSGLVCPLDHYGLYGTELKKTCRQLASACGLGEFHAEKGYFTGDLKSSIRTIVVRPPFAEDWTFFLRKFDSVKNRFLEELVVGENAGEVHRLLRLLVLGNQTISITGMQGSGKTTLLMSLIGEIPKNYTLRILEQVFELHLRRLYPERNVLTIRETETVSGHEGLNLLKKTDGQVTIIGEVADSKVAAWMIEAGQVASLFTLFTHHAKNVTALVHALRNSLLQEGIFTDERIAEEQVVEVLHFDVHLERDREGHRYISRISEILPVPGFGREKAAFEEVVLIRRNGSGGYEREHAISKARLEEMSAALTMEEQIYLNFYDELAQEEGELL